MITFRRFLLVSVCLLLLGAGAGMSPAGASEAAPSSGWQQVTAGSGHTCARTAGGRLSCWGDDFFGALGNGSLGQGTDQSAPVAVAGPVTNWTTVSAGEIHTCAVSTEARLYCWGGGDNGQLGTGNYFPSSLPVQVSGDATDWTTVAAGGTYTCGVRSTGTMFCWGNDFSGQLGNGAGSDDQLEPSAVAGGISDWSSVSTGRQHTCAVEATGRLYCWGRNTHGQLGDGTVVNRDAPVEVAGATTDWAAVSAGSASTCAVKTSGRLFCWGSDTHGMLGNGGATTGDRLVPSEVAGASTDWSGVGVGTASTCAVKVSGELFCWGSDADGRLGNGGANVDRARPVEVAGGVKGWRAVSVGGSHACARKATTRVFCWGRDREGQLGNGDPRHYSTVPVAVI